MDNIEIEFAAADLAEPVTFASTAAPAEGSPMTATGRGVVYGQLSAPYPLPNGEVVQFRFAAGSAQPAPDVMALYMHTRGQILGRTSNGTMRLNPVEGGVEFAVDLPDTQLGRDVAILLARGDLKASSVRMTAAKGVKAQQAGSPYPVVEVSSFTYPEISIVDDPGFANATATLLMTPAIVDNKGNAEPDSEAVEKSTDHKEEKARVAKKLKLAELRRQSIARARQ